jgi:predicted nucleotidyltransferase
MLGFRSKITIKVLNYYFLNPQKSHYVNELARLLDVDLANLFRKLNELEKEGILVSEMRGNQRYFSLNKKYPLLKELKKTFEAKYGILNLIKERLNKLKDLKEAFIFGSFAKNIFSSESDIDLLLIGKHSSLEAKRLILPLGKIMGREINILDMTEEEFKKRKRRKDEFINNIFSGKVIKIF